MVLRRAFTKHLFVLFMAAGTILFPQFFSQGAKADKFPAREVELIVSFAAGGGTDMVARIVAPKISDILKVPVVVSNKPGASGSIAASFVISSPDEGHRIFTASISNLGTLPASGAKVPYSIKEISAVAMALKMPIVLVTKKGRYESFEALLKEARQKPGAITFGSWGTNSAGHFAGELINQGCGVKMKHVPFDGGAKAMVAAMGGHVDVAMLSSATGLSNVKAGNLTCLATTSERRLDDYPGVPAVRELGYTEVVLEGYDGYATSSKVPKERLEILRSAFEKVLKDPEIQNAITGTGQIPYFLNGADYQVLIAESLEKMKSIAVKAGIAK